MRREGAFGDGFSPLRFPRLVDSRNFRDRKALLTGFLLAFGLGRLALRVVLG